MTDSSRAVDRESDIDAELAARLRAFVRYKRHTGKALHEWQSLLNLMSPRLRADAALHLNLEWIRKVGIFNSCTDEVVVALSFALRSQSFPPFERLITYGEKIEHMYVDEKESAHAPTHPPTHARTHARMHARSVPLPSLPLHLLTRVSRAIPFSSILFLSLSFAALCPGTSLEKGS